MKNKIKNIIKKSVHFTIRQLQKFSSGRFIVDQMLSAIMSTEYVIKNTKIDLRFVVPNSLNHMRADTFFTKEPETLEWIDNMSKNTILWDIGANIGLYSCYAALTKNIKVFAFEPSVFNLELLARNIYINNLVDKVTIIPLPLSESITENTLNMTSTELGGALSTFAEEFGDDGNKMNKVFDFKTLGFSMEDSLNLFNIPQPDFIKMDVDGIEHLILNGGLAVLREVNEILIEVNDDFSHQAMEVKKILTECGLVLSEKRQAEIISTSDRFGNTYNQIWKRVNAS